MANEKRLIDANALSDEVDKSKHNNPHPQGMIRVNHRNEHDHFLRMVNDAPTVDAVEVVRCKDCRCFDKSGYGEDNAHEEDLSLHMGWCSNWRRGTQACAFCSYGERKEEGT